MQLKEIKNNYLCNKISKTEFIDLMYKNYNLILKEFSEDLSKNWYRKNRNFS